MRPMLGLAILMIAAAGCTSIVQTQPLPPQAAPAQPVPMPGVAVDPGMFPECTQAGEFAFAGESTLAALGLGEMMGGPDASKPGMIWVTANPVQMQGPGGGVGMGMEAMPMQRMVCVQWPDGSGMSTTVPDGWEVPVDIGGDDAAEASATVSAAPVDLGPIAVMVAVVVLIGFSVLAFRREAAT